MKKLLCLSIVLNLLFLCSSCFKGTIDIPLNSSSVTLNSDIILDSTVESQWLCTNSEINYEESDFLNTENFNYKVDLSLIETCVPDKETAISISKVILNNLSVKHSQYKDYKPYLVKYDTDDEIWIVYFIGDGMVDGDISIAIRKKNSEIIRITAS